MLLVYVALGGALGSVLRAVIARTITVTEHNFPYGVLSVNVIGSFCIGALMAYMVTRLSDVTFLPQIRAFFMVGILGGFTTFSTFSLDALDLMMKGQLLKAAIYVLSTVILSIFAAAVGYYCLAN